MGVNGWIVGYLNGIKWYFGWYSAQSFETFFGIKNSHGGSRVVIFKIYKVGDFLLYIAKVRGVNTGNMKSAFYFQTPFN